MTLSDHFSADNRANVVYLQVSSQGPNVTWVRSARWVVDGNVWTSSGISAGIDMTFAFVEAQFGKEVADRFADAAEYRRIVDSTEDPFALLDE